MRKDNPNHQYITLTEAFEFFNRRLFGGSLTPTLITLQRKKGAYGYYSAERFESRAESGTTDEIALNPANFAGRTDRAILSTLVHEMVHHWQQYEGEPGRGRYHNEEWAAKMESVGLMPSDTGAPGGKRTGDRVSHYVVDGGPFDAACAELLNGGASVAWQSRENPPALKKPSSKIKYTCPECGLNIWAKPGVVVLCGECNEELEMQE